MPPVPARDVAADRLATTYVTAWNRVSDELDTILDNPLAWRRRRRLAELQESVVGMMDDLDDVARAWVSKQLPEVYAAGAAKMADAIQNAQQLTSANAAAATAAAAAQAAGQFGAEAGGFDWTMPHREAMQAVATETYGNLLDATSHVKQSTKEFIREVVHNEVLQKLTLGDTAKQAAKKIMREILAKNGPAAITYKNGARHGLGEYAEMVARTQTAIAYNTGSLVQCREDGVFWVEVFDGENCGWTAHDDVDLANGSVRTVEEASVFTIAHPRCLRSFGPRPDIAAGGAGPVSNILDAQAQAEQLAQAASSSPPANAATIAEQQANVKFAAPAGTPTQTAKKLTKWGLDPHVQAGIDAHGPVTKILSLEGGKDPWKVRVIHADGTKITWTKPTISGSDWMVTNVTEPKVAVVKAVPTPEPLGAAAPNSGGPIANVMTELSIVAADAPIEAGATIQTLINHATSAVTIQKGEIITISGVKAEAWKITQHDGSAAIFADHPVYGWTPYEVHDPGIDSAKWDSFWGATPPELAPVATPKDLAGPAAPTSSKFEQAASSVSVDGQQLTTPKQTAAKLAKLGAPVEATTGAKKIVSANGKHTIYYYDGTKQLWWKSPGLNDAWMHTEKVLTANAKKAGATEPTATEPAKVAMPEPASPKVLSDSTTDGVVEVLAAAGATPHSPFAQPIIENTDLVQHVKVTLPKGEEVNGYWLSKKDGTGLLVLDHPALGWTQYVPESAVAIAPTGEAWGLASKAVPIPSTHGATPLPASGLASGPVPSVTPPPDVKPITPTQTAKKLAKLTKVGLDPKYVDGALKITMDAGAKQALGAYGAPNGASITIHYPNSKVELTWLDSANAWVPKAGTGKPWSETNVAPVDVTALAATLATPLTAPPQPTGPTPPPTPTQTGKKLAKLATLAEAELFGGNVPVGSELDPDLLIGVTKITMNDAAKKLLAGQDPGGALPLFKLDYGAVPGKSYAKPTVKLAVKKLPNGDVEFVAKGTSWKKFVEDTPTTSSGGGSLAGAGFTPNPTPVPTPADADIRIGAKYGDAGYVKPVGYGTPTIIDENIAPAKQLPGPPPTGATRDATTAHPERDMALLTKLRDEGSNIAVLDSQVKGAWLLDGDNTLNATKMIVLTTNNNFEVYERASTSDPYWSKNPTPASPKDATKSFLSSVGLEPTGGEVNYTYRPANGTDRPNDGVIVQYENGAERLWLKVGDEWKMQTGVLPGSRESATPVGSSTARKITRADESALPRGVSLPAPMDPVFAMDPVPSAQYWDMDEAAKAAIAHYTTSHYRTVNGQLRGDSPLTPAVRKEVLNIERGIAAAPAPPLPTVVRGLYLDGMGLGSFSRESAAAFVNDNFPTGAVVDLPGLISTAYSTSPALNFSDHVLFEITVDPTSSAYIKGYSTISSEDEVLLSSRSRYVVTEIVENQQVAGRSQRAGMGGDTHNRTIVRLQQMPADWIDERGAP